MLNTTLIFLVKRKQNNISEICLGMKKRGFGKNRWNGVGGKVKESESIESAALREAKEEFNVEIKKIQKVAELNFRFLTNPDFDNIVHVYLTEEWTGEPSDSEEMSPKWFKTEEIPYSNMWPDDIYWLPQVLRGNKLEGKFTLGENDNLIDNYVNILNK